MKDTLVRILKKEKEDRYFQIMDIMWEDLKKINLMVEDD